MLLVKTTNAERKDSSGRILRIRARLGALADTSREVFALLFEVIGQQALQDGRLGRLLRTLRRSLATGYIPSISFSERGEDLLLIELESCRGFYVDVGAHHPRRYSNSARLADAGWTGCAIDVTEGFEREFAKHRPDCRTITGLVGAKSIESTIHVFDEELLNTTSECIAIEWQQQGRNLKAVVPTVMKPLHEWLDRVYGEPRLIDVLLVDAEGADFEILSGHDFDKWPVSKVLFEYLEPTDSPESNAILELATSSPSTEFLASMGFSITAIAGRNVLMARAGPEIPAEERKPRQDSKDAD